MRWIILSSNILRSVGLDLLGVGKLKLLPQRLKIGDSSKAPIKSLIKPMAPVDAPSNDTLSNKNLEVGTLFSLTPTIAMTNVNNKLVEFLTFYLEKIEESHLDELLASKLKMVANGLTIVHFEVSLSKVLKLDFLTFILLLF